MALIYETSYKNIATIGGKVIKFRPWTTKDEKEYFIATDNMEINDTLLYEILIKPCLENPDIILSKNEQKLLLIEIRKKSIGNTFPISFTCPSCKNVNEIDVRFDDVVKYNESSFKDVKIDDMVFSFTEKISENLYKRLDETNSTIEWNFVELAIHISSIEINGRLEDNFTFDELYSFLESIPASIFNDLLNEFNNMKSILKFELNSNCIICNNDIYIDLETIPNFLWE